MTTATGRRTRRSGGGGTARAAGALAAAMLAATTLGAPAASAGPAAGPAAANADAAAVDKALNWGDCPPAALTGPGTVCADVEVPRDHADPDGETITLTVSRVPATGERWGAIAGNPGGPGGDALGMFAPGMVEMPDAVREHYDLIAVEPRGLTWGTPLNCNVADLPNTGVLAGQVGLMYAACEGNQLGYAATVTTPNTARDLDVVRERLGDERIGLYGLSYGTDLMSTYATLFPQRVSGLVLDSGLDPAQRYFDIGAAREPWRRASLEAMFAWIAERDDVYGLGTTPLQVYRAWSDRVNAEAGAPGQAYPPPAQVGDLPGAVQGNADEILPLVDRIAPVVWRGKSAAAALTGKVAMMSPTMTLTFDAMYSEGQWPLVAETIRDGAPESATNPQLPEGVTQEDVLAQMTAMQTVERAIICNDNRNAADPTRIPRGTVDQFTGGDMFRVNADLLKSGQLCAGWPGQGAAIDLTGAELDVEPLLLHFTNDSATTGVGGRALQATMGGDLHEYEGHNHGVLVAGNEREGVDELVAAHYLGG
ncbi:alpha/beta fold hydrolase [Corynebacterium sp. 335C]